MLTKNGCIARQDRWREQMLALDLDAVAVLDYRDIYYFTGALVPAHLPGTPVPLLLMMFADGETLLFVDSASAEGSFDALIPDGKGWGVSEIIVYPWATGSTTNPDTMSRLALAVEDKLIGRKGVRRIGFQYEYMPWLLARSIIGSLRAESFSPVDGTLSAMQARKDTDEIACIRESIRLVQIGYDAVKAALHPDVTELEVLRAAQTAIIAAAGKPVYVNGDFRCGELGGFARNQKVTAGALYVVDMWVYHHGYWADMSRTFIVGGEPTAFQRELYDHLAKIHTDIPRQLKPGMDGRAAYALVNAQVKMHPALKDGLPHHAGHAIGLRAHEQPDLNPDRGGVLEPGCVFTLEPGGYPAEAKGGVRLENVYQMTETGAVSLSSYPFALA